MRAQLLVGFRLRKRSKVERHFSHAHLHSDGNSPRDLRGQYEIEQTQGKSLNHHAYTSPHQSKTPASLPANDDEVNPTSAYPASSPMFSHNNRSGEWRH